MQDVVKTLEVELKSSEALREVFQGEIEDLKDRIQELERTIDELEYEDSDVDVYEIEDTLRDVRDWLRGDLPHFSEAEMLRRIEWVINP